MRQKVYIIAASTFLLSFFVIALLWARSYRGGDVFGWPTGPTTVWTLVSQDGILSLKMLSEIETPFSGNWEGDRRPGDDQRFWESASGSNKVWQVRPSLFPYEIGWSKRRGPFVAQRFGYTYGVIMSSNARISVSGQKFAVLAPFWSIASTVGLLTSFPTVVSVRQLVRGRTSRLRTRAGQCPVCGYDLRGSADRCPECGTARIGSNPTVA